MQTTTNDREWISCTKPCLCTREPGTRRHGGVTRDAAGAWRFANYSRPVRTIALCSRAETRGKKAAGVDRTKAERKGRRERSGQIENRSLRRESTMGFIIRMITEKNRGTGEGGRRRRRRAGTGERKGAILSLSSLPRLSSFVNLPVIRARVAAASLLEHFRAGDHPRWRCSQYPRLSRAEQRASRLDLIS